MAGIFFRAFACFKNETLMELLERLIEVKPILGEEFMNRLILHEDFGVGLSDYAGSRYFQNHFFIGFLNKIQMIHCRCSTIFARLIPSICLQHFVGCIGI
jgi:hypothetical protein